MCGVKMKTSNCYQEIGWKQWRRMQHEQWVRSKRYIQPSFAPKRYAWCCIALRCRWRKFHRSFQEAGAKKGRHCLKRKTYWIKIIENKIYMAQQRCRKLLAMGKRSRCTWFYQDMHRESSAREEFPYPNRYLNNKKTLTHAETFCKKLNNFFMMKFLVEIAP